MKKYLAVGHWDGNSNTTSVADTAKTKADFAETLRMNGFRAYVILTETTFNKMKEMGAYEIHWAVQGLSSNWRKYDEIVDYIDQCRDIMESKLAKVES